MISGIKFMNARRTLLKRNSKKELNRILDLINEIRNALEIAENKAHQVEKRISSSRIRKQK